MTLPQLDHRLRAWRGRSEFDGYEQTIVRRCYPLGNNFRSLSLSHRIKIVGSFL